MLTSTNLISNTKPRIIAVVDIAPLLMEVSSV